MAIAAYLIHIPVLLLLGFWLYRESVDQPLRKLFWAGFVLKLTAGLALGWVYTSYYHYQADTILYFEDASKLAQLAWSKPLSYVKILLYNQFEPEITFGLAQQPRAFFMAKLVSLFTVFTGNNYWTTGLYLSLLSFYGFWRLANTLAVIFPTSRIAAAIAFLLFPSVVFWSSGLIKETIAMACICGNLHLLLAYNFNVNAPASALKKTGHGVILLLAVYLVWKLKYYYLAVFIPVYLAYLAALYLHKKLLSASNPIVLILIYLLLFSGILAGVTMLHPSLHTDVLLGTIIENHDVTLAASTSENVIHFTQLQPTFISLVKNAPLAVVSGLFRPLIWEGNSLFQYFTGAENLFILFTSLITLLLSRQVPVSKHPQVYLLLVAAILYILLLATLLAFSAPNFGALARYKVGFFPFLLYLSTWAIIFKKESIKNKFCNR
jgi:hypothetical protein